MRSILNGMVLAMITMFFSTWFLSTSVLKTIQAGKSSSSVNEESVSEKVNYGKKSVSVSGTPTSISSYTRSSRRRSSGSGAVRFKKARSPFGSKLSIRSKSNPFAPKLRLRGNAWQQLDRKPRVETKQRQKEYQQTTTSSKTTSSSPIISGYQNYIDILNEQMKD